MEPLLKTFGIIFFAFGVSLLVQMIPVSFVTQCFFASMMGSIFILLFRR